MPGVPPSVPLLRDRDRDRSLRFRFCHAYMERPTVSPSPSLVPCGLADLCAALTLSLCFFSLCFFLSFFESFFFFLDRSCT